MHNILYDTGYANEADACNIFEHFEIAILADGDSAELVYCDNTWYIQIQTTRLYELITEMKNEGFNV